MKKVGTSTALCATSMPTACHARRNAGAKSCATVVLTDLWGCLVCGLLCTVPPVRRPEEVTRSLVHRMRNPALCNGSTAAYAGAQLLGWVQ